MESVRSLGLACASLLLCSVCAAQRTWVVDSLGGPGVDFTDLPPAVWAAARGDTVLVRPGTGAPYGFAMTITKGIRIIGEAGGSTRVRGRCVVRAIRDGELFVLDNIDLSDFSGTLTALVIEDCRGTVLVSGLQDGNDQLGGSGATRSSRVVYSNCRLITPRSAMRFDYSGVWLINCDVRGHFLAYPGNPPGAVRGRFCDLWVIGGYYKGADGFGNDCGNVNRPEIGMTVHVGRAVLCGGVTIEGGHCAATGYRAPALEQVGVNPPGWQVRDPNVQFIGQVVHWPSVTLLHHEVTSIFPDLASRGAPQSIDVIGPSNGIVSVYASFAHGYAPIRLPVGDVWLDPALTLHVSTGPVDPQRQYQATTTIPSWLPVGSTLVYQAVALTSSGRFELSTPGFAVVQ